MIVKRNPREEGDQEVEKNRRKPAGIENVSQNKGLGLGTPGKGGRRSENTAKPIFSEERGRN